MMDVDKALSDFSISFLKIQGANLATRAIVLNAGIPSVAVTLVPVHEYLSTLAFPIACPE